VFLSRAQEIGVKKREEVIASFFSRGGESKVFS
jgi:hypothetical protein